MGKPKGRSPVSEQERFWAGDFGNEYTQRNRGTQMLASNVALFSRVLSGLGPCRNMIEFGANIGLNLQAIRQLLPEIDVAAVEINAKALLELKKIPGIQVEHGSLLEWQGKKSYDLVLVKGVLIHLDPAVLNDAYEILHRATLRYLCLAEYYNPSPVELEYRGHRGKLFKRDFAGKSLDRYSDWQLSDYGFSYHRDAHFPQDDLTWFVLEKKG